MLQFTRTTFLQVHFCYFAQMLYYNRQSQVQIYSLWKYMHRSGRHFSFQYALQTLHYSITPAPQTGTRAEKKKHDYYSKHVDIYVSRSLPKLSTNAHSHNFLSHSSLVNCALQSTVPVPTKRQPFCTWASSLHSVAPWQQQHSAVLGTSSPT